MDGIKPCAACASATMRGCDAGCLCGPYAQVVYVALPVFKPCSSCQNTCVVCHKRNETGQNEEKSNEMSRMYFSEMNALKSDCADAEMIRCRCHAAECASSHPMGLNNNLCGLAICHSGHLLGSTAERKVMLCPTVQHTCCVHGPPVNSVAASTPSQQEKDATSHGNGTNSEGATNSKVHRRPSADSGRVTWSDSGDSVFSDIQGGDSLQRTSTSTPKTWASTSRSQFTPPPTITTVSHTPPLYVSNGETTGPRIQERNVFELELRSLPTGTDFTYTPPATESQLSVVSSRRLATSPSVRQKVPVELPHNRSEPRFVQMPNTNVKRRYTNQRQLEQKEYASPVPRRSNSEWALRQTPRAKILSPTLERLTEYNTHMLSGRQRRPRSRSLFFSPTEQAEMPFLMSLPEALRHRTPHETLKVDFTAWSEVLDSWEISGDTNGKEGMKAYGITAVPCLDGFAVTDADKVKIKIYGIDGDLKTSFGTPTWPRYGRGITLTPDRTQIAVCHLSEVCVYTLEGKVVDRFAHENFTACWGIVCNAEGNFVITDPKSSSVFIMTPSGKIVKQIGGITIKPAFRKQSKTTSISWRKSKYRQKSPSLKQRQTSDSMRRMSNVSLSGMNTRRSSSSSTEGKRQVRLLAPRYVAVNSKNQIIVTDTKQRCIIAFDTDGTLLFSIGGGRIGCNKCCLGEEKCTGYSVPATETLTKQRDDSLESTRRTSLSPTKQQVKSAESPHNILSEICGPSSLCAAKHERVKVLGAVYRGNIGRDQSAESAEYHPKEESRANDEYGKVTELNRSVSQPQCVSSTSVGNRLCSYSEELSGPCTSYIELPGFTQLENELQDAKTNNQWKLKLLKSRIFKTPRCLSRRNRKKVPIVTMSQVGKCESLTSISNNGLPILEDGAQEAPHIVKSQSADSFSLSPSTAHRKYQYTPQTNVTTFTYDSFKGRSMPTSPLAGAVFSESPLSPDVRRSCGDLHDSDYAVSSDYGPEVELEDMDRVACRRCHVEDPRGVCVDHEDNILLVDRARHRVTVFTPEGHFVRHVLTKDDGLHEPMIVGVLADGSLAVTDSSSCVKIFRFAHEF